MSVEFQIVFFNIMSHLFETIARYALPVTIGISALNSSMYNVDAGHRAVLFDRVRGVLPVPQGEGTHFLIPWLQKAIFFDVRTKPRNISTTTGSKDMQVCLLLMPDCIAHLKSIASSRNFRFTKSLLYFGVGL
jgi:hypothetical protein